jgi:C4-dicarboxylate-specific signal transduction histidine kinase
VTRANVLIAEDAGISAEELCQRLVAIGLTVGAVVASGEEAIAQTAATAPDLVLMGIRLQGELDGVDAAAVIRDRFQIPVVFVTADSDGETVERATEVDPLGYLIKPFTDQELEITIRIALHRHSKDVIARRLLETQKLESLGRMAGSVAHAFSNLLVPIMGHASVAALEVDPQSKAAGHLERISAAAERAAELCRQMRAYTGIGNVEIGPCDVNEMVLEIADLLKVAVSANRATLRFELADDLPAVEGDRNQLQQLVMNLVLNGAEAVSTNGTVIVRTLRSGSDVVIEVADNGAGIAVQAQAHIFEPFFTTKFIGRGLGLAAAQGIARTHRGAISFESTPNVGSTFRVHLPTPASAITVS